MQNILQDIQKKNDKLINNSVLQEIQNEHQKWGKNVPSKITAKNKIFESFKNIHENDIGIIFFTGASINNTTIDNIIQNVKKENPNKNIIGYGCSKIYNKPEILPYLKYYQFGDGYVYMHDYQKNLNKLVNENSHITMFASAYANNSLKNNFTNESIATMIKNTNAYPIDTGNLFNIEKEISIYPLTNHFQGMPITQQLLYMGMKKIYLVGSDCTVTTGGHGSVDAYGQKIGWQQPVDSGYFYEKTITEQIAEPHYIYWWIRMKDFIQQNYPNTELISINPVGLKGIFKDIYLD